MSLHRFIDSGVSSDTTTAKLDRKNSDNAATATATATAIDGWQHGSMAAWMAAWQHMAAIVVSTTAELDSKMSDDAATATAIDGRQHMAAWQHSHCHCH